MLIFLKPFGTLKGLLEDFIREEFSWRDNFLELMYYDFVNNKRISSIPIGKHCKIETILKILLFLSPICFTPPLTSTYLYWALLDSVLLLLYYSREDKDRVIIVTFIIKALLEGNILVDKTASIGSC